MAELDSSPISSVSILQEASLVSLVILDAAPKIRRNKTEFHRLANDASKFIDNMISLYEIMDPYFPSGVPDDLAVVFQRSLNSLKYLRNFTRRVASRNFLTALLFSRSDMKEIQAHELSLLMNKGSFKIISNAHLKDLADARMLSAETVVALNRRFEAAAAAA